MTDTSSSTVSTASASTSSSSPFEGFHLSSHDSLHAIRAGPGGRSLCKRCGKTRLMYCYSCCCPLDAAPAPHVKLPLHADIWHHRTEHKQKSTALHARILAPDDVSLIEFPSETDALCGTYGPETVLLFPSPTSVAVEAMPDDMVERVTRVVVIDSQWQKTGGMLAHPALKGLQHVRIKGAKTAFWRHQSHGPDYLSTIEALYWFMREFWIRKNVGLEYNGEVDDLLWYFSFNYEVVQQFYKQRPDKTFKRIKDYIKYDTPAPSASASQEDDHHSQHDDDEEQEEQVAGESASKKTRK